MIDYIVSHMGYIVVTLVLVLIVAAIIVRMMNDHTAGKSACSGACKGCANAPYCHPQAFQETHKPAN